QCFALAQVGDGNEVDHRQIALLPEQIELVEHERKSAAHASAEVSSCFAEKDDGAASHILAAVIADTFDNRDRTAVAHRESLAGGTGEVSLARCRAVKNRV